MVERKLYVTGGVGARHLAESFGQPHELPNDLAYCETCGAIASIMWSWRMLLATGQARYADLVERTLYNAVAGRRVAGRRPVLLREPAGEQRRAGISSCPAQAVVPRGLLPAECDASARLARRLCTPPATPRASSSTCTLRPVVARAPPSALKDAISVGRTGPPARSNATSARHVPLALRVPGWCSGASVARQRW